MKKRKTQRPVRLPPPEIYRVLNDGPQRWVAVRGGDDECPVFSTIQDVFDHLDWRHEGNFVMTVHGIPGDRP